MQHAKRNQYKTSSTDIPTSTSSVSFSTSTSSQSNDGNVDSPSLYLFVFLAILFLLVLISCGVMIRAIVLRRRLSRTVQNALASGVILPTTFGGQGSWMDFGEKPKFYDAWIQPGEEKWESMMPISARINPNPSSLRKAIDAADTTPSTHTHRTLASFTRWRSRPRQSSTPSNQLLSTPFTLSRLAPEDAEVRSVQVSVLVAMPSPKFKSSFDPDEDAEVEMLPEVMVGVAQVPYQTESSAKVSEAFKLEEINANA